MQRNIIHLIVEHVIGDSNLEHFFENTEDCKENFCILLLQACHKTPKLTSSFRECPNRIPVDSWPILKVDKPARLRFVNGETAMLSN